jgi:hypothetical protein
MAIGASAMPDVNRPGRAPIDVAVFSQVSIIGMPRLACWAANVAATHGVANEVPLQ